MERTEFSRDATKLLREVQYLEKEIMLLMYIHLHGRAGVHWVPKLWCWHFCSGSVHCGVFVQAQKVPGWQVLIIFASVRSDIWTNRQGRR